MWSEKQHTFTAVLPWLAALFAAVALSSCDNGSEPHPDPAAGREVYIRAAVGNKSSSRGPFEAGAPSVDTPLDAVVWATPTSHSYTSATGALNKPAVVETKVLFLSGEPQLIKGIEYPADKSPLYFVAMHPETGWASEGNNVAYHSFSGCEDLLFAKETHGSYGDTNQPKLEFKHLLTQLCVKLRAESEEAAEAWGKLKSLTVKSLNRASISISTDEPSFYFDGSETDFNFFIAGTDAIFPGDDDTLPYDGTKKEAYVLCAPIMDLTGGTDTADKKYIIILETENRKIKQSVDMTDIGTEAFAGGSTMGHKFTLDICLKLGYNITTETTVDKWVYGGSASTTVDQ